MEVDLTILTYVTNIYCDVPSYLQEDENLEVMVAACHVLNQKTRRKNIPKIKGYVEHIVPSLTAIEFKSHFR